MSNLTSSKSSKLPDVFTGITGRGKADIQAPGQISPKTIGSLPSKNRLNLPIKIKIPGTPECLVRIESRPLGLS